MKGSESSEVGTFAFLFTSCCCSAMRGDKTMPKTKGCQCSSAEMCKEWTVEGVRRFTVGRRRGEAHRQWMIAVNVDGRGSTSR